MQFRLPSWKGGDRGFETRSGIQLSKKQNVSSLLTRDDLLLWGPSVTGGQCLEGSVISCISPSSGGSPGPV